MIDEYEKTEVRSRKIIRVILVFCIGALILLLMIKILGGSTKTAVLPIRKVQVFGNSYVKNDELLQMINLDTHRSLLFFNKKAVKITLLNDRRISGVEILKVYPDTLKIYVAEKRKKYQLTDGEHTYWMSADAVVLGPVKEGEDLKFPLITLHTNSDDIRIGGEIMSFMVLDIFGSLKELEKKHPDFYRRIQSFYIRADGAYVHLKDRGFEVYLGSRITIDKLEKLRALTLILENYTTNGSSVEDIEKIDLSLTYAAVQKGERKNELR